MLTLKFGLWAKITIHTQMLNSVYIHICDSQLADEYVKIVMELFNLNTSENPHFSSFVNMDLLVTCINEFFENQNQSLVLK